MNEALKIALLAAGLSPEVITKLEEQELHEVSDFTNLEVRDLVAAGIKLGSASKIMGVVKFHTPPPAPPLPTTPVVELQVVTAPPVAPQAPAVAPPVLTAPALQAAPPAPTPAVPQSSGSDLVGLVSMILPPQTPQDAAERLCRAPSDTRCQGWWRKEFNNETLIFSPVPGAIDREKTLEVVEIWLTSGAAPTEIDGQPLLNLDEFLQSTFAACPFSGARIIRGGMSLQTNVHYGFLLKGDVSLGAVQSNPGMNFLAFAAETGKIAHDLDTWKTHMLEFRALVEGKDLSSPQAIKAAVAGSVWDETATDYIRDANNGGIVAMKARARLLTQAKRRTARTQLTGIGSGRGRGEDV